MTTDPRAALMQIKGIAGDTRIIHRYAREQIVQLARAALAGSDSPEGERSPEASEGTPEPDDSPGDEAGLEAWARRQETAHPGLQLNWTTRKRRHPDGR